MTQPRCLRNLPAHAALIVVLTAAAVPIRAQDPEPGGCAGEATDTVQEPDGAPPGNAPSNAVEDARDRIYYPGDTERFKPLVHKLAGNIFLDQKEIWTSPFHMHSKDAKWWIIFGGATAGLIATDHRTLLAINASRVSWSNNFSRIGTSYTLIPLVAGLYGYGVLRDDPKPREAGILGAEALLDSLIVVQVLKPIAGRNRPDAARDQGHFFDGGASFPSGHAIESWALASVLAHEYGHTKIVPIVAIGLAGVVSVARFSAQKHFASDIVAGGAMGWFIGTYVYRTHMDHAIHHHFPTPRIAPLVQPGSHTYAIGLTFYN